MGSGEELLAGWGDGVGGEIGWSEAGSEEAGEDCQAMRL